MTPSAPRGAWVRPIPRGVAGAASCGRFVAPGSAACTLATVGFDGEIPTRPAAVLRSAVSFGGGERPAAKRAGVGAASRAELRAVPPALPPGNAASFARHGVDMNRTKQVYLRVVAPALALRDWVARNTNRRHVSQAVGLLIAVVEPVRLQVVPDKPRGRTAQGARPVTGKRECLLLRPILSAVSAGSWLVSWSHASTVARSG